MADFLEGACSCGHCDGKCRESVKPVTREKINSMESYPEQTKRLNFELKRERVTQARWAMGDAKGRAYTAGSSDPCANFKRNAERLNTTPEIVWSVYVNKHIDAIMAYTSKGIEGPDGVLANIDDVQNYLDLLRVMVEEKKNALKI